MKNEDLISRKEVLGLTRDICVPTKDGTEYRHRCIDPGDVSELSSMSTWISVSERLPEDTERYLVTLANGDIDIGWIRGDEYLWDLVDIDCEYFLSDKRYQVVAWMPLPEPYKEAMR